MCLSCVRGSPNTADLTFIILQNRNCGVDRGGEEEEESNEKAQTYTKDWDCDSEIRVHAGYSAVGPLEPLELNKEKNKNEDEASLLLLLRVCSFYGGGPTVRIGCCCCCCCQQLCSVRRLLTGEIVATTIHKWASLSFSTIKDHCKYKWIQKPQQQQHWAAAMKETWGG